MEHDRTRRPQLSQSGLTSLCQLLQQWYPCGVIGRISIQMFGCLLEPPKKGRGRGHPHQDGLQKNDILAECPTETAYSKSQKVQRDLKTNCKEWLEMNREIIRYTEESMQATWHRRLDRIFKKLRMPSKYGLWCTPCRGRSLIPLESRYCTEVESTPAAAQRP